MKDYNFDTAFQVCMHYAGTGDTWREVIHSTCRCLERLYALEYDTYEKVCLFAGYVPN